MLIWGLIGCSSSQKAESDMKHSQQNEEVPTPKKGFQLISEQEPLSGDVQAWIESAKMTEGVHTLVSGGVRYVLLSLGERPNAGYRIEVVEIEEAPNYSTVFVREKKPDPNMFYPQVISYPYVLGTSEKEVRMEILEK